MQFIVFIIIYISSFVFFLKKAGCKTVLSPIIWLLFAWSLVLGMWLFSGIKYNYVVSKSAIFYLVSCLLCFGCFYYLGGAFLKRRKIPRKKFQIKNVQFLEVLATIGAIMCIYQVLSSGNFDFGNRISIESRPIGNIGSILSQLGTTLWIYLLGDSILNNKMPPKSSFLCLFDGVIYALLTGNRWSIFYAIFSTLLTYVYAKKKNTSYKYDFISKLLILMVGIVGIAYIGYVIFARFGNRNYTSMYNNVYNASMSSSLSSFLGKMNGGLRLLVEQAIYYFSQEIPYFSQIFDQYDFSPKWGAFQFHYISRRFPNSLYLQFKDATDAVTRIGRSNGVLTGVYRTAISSFIIDYGRVGALIFCCFLGFLIGRYRKAAKHRDDYYSIIEQIIISMGCVFSIISSPFSDGWAYIFYWSLLLPLLGRSKHKIVFKLRH